MPDKRQTLPPERLREVLHRLDEVLGEAERLRDEIERRLDDQRVQQQQHLSPISNSRKKRGSR